MLEGIDHIAIKVERIESVRNAYEAMGYKCTDISRYDEVGMKIAFFENGDSRLELLEVYSDDSPAASSPLGVHHIAIKSADIDSAFLSMKDDGRYIVEGVVRPGAHGRIFFFRLKDEADTLYECVEH